MADSCEAPAIAETAGCVLECVSTCVWFSLSDESKELLMVTTRCGRLCSWPLALSPHPARRRSNWQRAFTSHPAGRRPWLPPGSSGLKQAFHGLPHVIVRVRLPLALGVMAGRRLLGGLLRHRLLGVIRRRLGGRLGGRPASIPYQTAADVAASAIDIATATASGIVMNVNYE